MPRPDDDDRLGIPETLWPAPEPRDDFVARVGARIARDVAPAAPRRRPRRIAHLGLAAAAAAAIAMIVVLVATRRSPGTAAQGSLSATELTTIALRDRAIVVAYPGTVLAWSVAADGATEVHMSAGDAFFRVERGGGFVVHTPSGDVVVTGTCFTVAVDAARTAVDVHEGQVELRGGARTISLRPGERGHVGSDAPARRRPAPRSLAAPPAAATAAPPPAPPSAARGDDCYCRSDPRHLEADQPLLDEWAAVCRIRADLPPLAEEDDPTPIEAVADQLGLGGDERRAFQEAAHETLRVADRRLREIYVAATGDAAGAATIDQDAMVEQIELTRTLGEDARLRAALSQERAGHAVPPADASALTPYEEMYRELIALGDDFERRLAARLGAGRARELRLRFGGWPGPDLDWIGCPPP